jgi:hypothetical protein
MELQSIRKSSRTPADPMRQPPQLRKNIGCKTQLRNQAPASEKILRHPRYENQIRKIGSAKSGKPGIALKLREDHCTREKIRMKCVWKNLLRYYRVRRLPEFRLRSLELAIGFEPTTL